MAGKTLNPIGAVTLVELAHHSAENGDLVVMEGLERVPFAIARVFVVTASPGMIRGQHAHKLCSQFLTCPAGSVEVLCDDGQEVASFVLDRFYMGLHVPPGIWAQQTYLTPGSVLTVLCDRPFEPEDYIRDYGAFRAYRAAGRSGKD